MEKNRAELSVHTKLSDELSVLETPTLLEASAEHCISTIAFTNFNNVQDFANIAPYEKRLGVKFVYGVKVCFKQNGQNFHASLLVKNQKGLKNLYKIISAIKNENGVDCVDLKVIKKNRENLIIGFCAEKSLPENLNFFDYCEIYPTDDEKQKAFYKSLCEISNIPVVASSNCHYLKFDDFHRKIIIDSFEDFKENSKLYLHTTDELLKEFSFLGIGMAHNVVIKNSNAIADLIEEVNPLNEKIYLPKIENAFEELEQEIYKNAKEIYGEDLPEDVSKRLQQEIEYLSKEEFYTRFAIAHKIAKHYNKMGLKVGTRGDVGSTLSAFLLNLSSANPLPAHYYCSKCYHYEASSEAVDGFDLPEKVCPVCGKVLKKDGHNIPFESYFYFDKMKNQNIAINVPTSKLNEGFAVLKEMFGEDHVAFAGTVSTISMKTAESFLKRYKEKNGEIYAGGNEGFDEYLCLRMLGIKRSNGQHPFGVFIFPQEMEFEDLTPIRQVQSQTPIKYATHLDFHHLLGNVLKQDVLPFAVLDIIYDLEKATGKRVDEIDFSDSKIYELFASADIDGIVGFENDFERDLLLKFKPKTFAELVKIYGFAYSTNMWKDNGELLFEKGVPLSQIPATKDDIFNDLISFGANRKNAFKFTNEIRRGKMQSGEMLIREQEHLRVFTDKARSWYYDFCSKVRYAFPKAHAVEYVLFALKLAWYKVYFPQEFADILEKYK